MSQTPLYALPVPGLVPGRAALAIPGTGTAYRPTALATVGPYALPVPGFVPRLAPLARVLFGRDWYFIAEQPAPAPHLAHPEHPEGCAALRVVLVTVPRVSRSCELFPDGFDLHLLLLFGRHAVLSRQHPHPHLSECV